MCQEDGWQRQRNEEQCNNQLGQAKGKWEVGGGGSASRGRGLPRGWHTEAQGHTKRMSGGGNATTSRRGAPRYTERMTGGGNATTSWTRGAEGHGATRGNGKMRGRGTGRLEAAAKGKQEVGGGGCALRGRGIFRGRGAPRG